MSRRITKAARRKRLLMEASPRKQESKRFSHVGLNPRELQSQFHAVIAGLTKVLIWACFYMGLFN